MKDFIPYEQSLELKELGFDEPCIFVYEEKIFNQWSGTYQNHMDWKDIISAPTFSQAFRWFREKYDIHYSIDRECSQHDHKWGYNWSLYNYTGIFDEFLTSHPDAPAGEWVYKTYEEAELACLKKLIEIVKLPKEN